MRPPTGFCAFMMRNAACRQKKAPFRLVSTTDLHCSTVRSSSRIGGAPMPALLNRKSNRPNRSLVRAKSASTESESATSACTAIARAPSAPACATAASSFSTRRPASTTDQPSARSASAAALPIPLPAPVTSAILTCSVIGASEFALQPVDHDAVGLRRLLLLGPVAAIFDDITFHVVADLRQAVGHRRIADIVVARADHQRRHLDPRRHARREGLLLHLPVLDDAAIPVEPAAEAFLGIGVGEIVKFVLRQEDLARPALLVILEPVDEGHAFRVVLLGAR